MCSRRHRTPLLSTPFSGCAAWLALLLVTTPALAAIDLRNATVEVLDNGLTVILLEDRRFPVVSVQALYRVGARNEETGKTGLAHFLEHMAFRDSRHFPGTDIVGRIYAVGGEWHGYTWIDQTTYYSTVPREHVDLLLRIEADRMSGLELQPEDMDAERGAVLAELHMYENLPTSMLIDAVNFTSFLAHPYRNNTIGWESDLLSLGHADVVDFYQRHYHPANAVLAVVGDFERETVRERIDELFAPLARRPATPLPHTVEPPQQGLRRITLRASDSRRQFMIAYRAPSANSVDYAPFLVLQELLGGGSGVNFLQNDWGTPAGPDAPLFGVADDITTWFPPSAQPYVFIIGGRAPTGAETAAVEAGVEARVAALRGTLVDRAALASAVDRVHEALVRDVQTTEDAAHQLAFFAGLGALDTLLELPERVRAVTAADVQAVAQRYLDPSRRSIAWHLPGPEYTPTTAATATRTLPAAKTPAPPGKKANPRPFARRLSGGLPVVGQVSDFSPLVELLVVLPSTGVAGASGNEPILGHSSYRYSGSSGELESLVRAAAADLAAIESRKLPAATPSPDPATRLEQEFEVLLGSAERPPAASDAPALIAVAGDFDEDELFAGLERHFGEIAPGAAAVVEAPELPAGPRVVHLGRALAQAQLGYVARAPGPGEPLADASRLLLYVLSHDYEGRLGKKAISDSGLAYYIDSRYRSDGKNAWITLATGVDPEKLDQLEELFAAEIDRLLREPPTATELHEARQHQLGRRQSAAQSNAELTEQLAIDWLWHGRLRTAESIRQSLDAVDEAAIQEAALLLGRGIQVVVRE